MGDIDDFQLAMETSFHELLGKFFHDQKIRSYESVPYELPDMGFVRDIYFSDDGKRLNIKIKLVDI